MAKPFDLSLVGALPPEVLLEVFEQLPAINDVLSLAATSKNFQSVFRRYQAHIIETVVRRRYQPLPDLVQLLTADVKHLMYPGDSFRKRQHPGYSPMIVKKVISICKEVDKWINVYPTLCFRYDSDNRRWLNEHEQFRLRRALYKWWTYSFYFHGTGPRPSPLPPAPNTDDPRACFMRRCSTAELMELLDLWDRVYDMVKDDICPSRADVRDFLSLYLFTADTFKLPPSEKFVDIFGWGNRHRNERIVETYMKLSPSVLLAFYTGPITPRKRIRAQALALDPDLGRDRESLTHAAKAVLGERAAEALHANEDYPRLWPEDLEGGILDWDDPEADKIRRHLEHDASPDGYRPFEQLAHGHPRNYLSLADLAGDDGGDDWVYS